MPRYFFLRFIAALAVASGAAFSQPSIGWRFSDVVGPGSTNLNVPPTQTIIEPYSVAVDKFDVLYYWDQRCYIRRISSTGMVQIAGNGVCGYSGDGGLATNASIGPFGRMAFDSSGNLYFTDASTNHRIRKIGPGGVISSVGPPSLSGGGEPIAIDPSGNIWVAEYMGKLLRTTPDGQQTQVTTLPSGVSDLSIDSSGVLYAAASYYVLRITQGGVVTQLFATNNPTAGIAVESDGTLDYASSFRVFRRPQGGIGSPRNAAQALGTAGDDGPASLAYFDDISDVALDSKRGLFLCQKGRIRYIAPDGNVRTIAGGFFEEGGVASQAQLLQPGDVTKDASGNIYLIDRFVVRKISADGKIRTFAGNGISAPHTEGGQALSSSLPLPLALAADELGNLFIGCSYAGILKVSPSGIITKFSNRSVQPGGMAATAGTLFIRSGSLFRVKADGSETLYPDTIPASGISLDGQKNVWFISAGGELTRMASSGVKAVLASAVAGVTFGDYLTVDTAGNAYFGSPFGMTKYDATTSSLVTFPVSVNGAAIFAEGSDNLLFADITNISTYTLLANSPYRGQSLQRLSAVPCRYSLSSYSLYYRPGDGFDPVSITAPAGCPWTVQPGSAALAVDPPTASGTGPGIVQISLASTTSSSTPATFSAVIAGHKASFVVTGQALTAVTPLYITAEGQSSTLNLTATDVGTGTWTSSGDRSWIQTFPASGTGPATLYYTIFPNFTSTVRTGSFMVGGRLVPITQAASTLTAEERLVQRFYFNFFGRLPTSAELAFQVTSIRSLGRATLFDSFFRSPEFTNSGRFIAGLYAGLLNRNSEYAGWLFQRTAVSSGAISHTALISNFLSSQEFVLQNGTLSNDAFVKLLYRQILLRNATQAEADFQASTLATVPRANMADNFLLSAEFRIGTGPRLTAFLLYALALGRDANMTEFADYVSRLQGGATVPSLAEELVNTDEFTALNQ